MEDIFGGGGLGGGLEEEGFGFGLGGGLWCVGTGARLSGQVMIYVRYEMKIDFEKL